MKYIPKSTSDDSKPALTPDGIAGVVIAGIVVLSLLIAGMTYYFYRHRNKYVNLSDEDVHVAPQGGGRRLKQSPPPQQQQQEKKEKEKEKEKWLSVEKGKGLEDLEEVELQEAFAVERNVVHV